MRVRVLRAALSAVLYCVEIWKQDFFENLKFLARIKGLEEGYLKQTVRELRVFGNNASLFFKLYLSLNFNAM